ncbi:uncharacterized protein ACNFOS_007307 [Eudromia elegans]
MEGSRGAELTPTHGSVQGGHGSFPWWLSRSWIHKFLRARPSGEESVRADGSLGNAAQGRSLLLQAEQKPAFLEAFQAKTCRRQDAEDLRNDSALVDNVLGSVKKADVDKREDITEIRREQLAFRRHPQDTDSHDLYEGEYLKHPVATGTLTRPLTTDSSGRTEWVANKNAAPPSARPIEAAAAGAGVRAGQ